MKERLFIIYCIWCLLMTIISFILFATDKKKAERGQNRISETALLMSVSLGGAIGGLLGIKVLRHKSNFATKWHFYIIDFLGLVDQIALGIYLFIMR